MSNKKTPENTKTQKNTKQKAKPKHKSKPRAKRKPKVTSVKKSHSPKKATAQAATKATPKKKAAKKKPVKKTAVKKTAVKKSVVKKSSTKKATTKKRPTKKAVNEQNRTSFLRKLWRFFWRFFVFVCLPLMLVLGIFLALWLKTLNQQITTHFESKRWEIPAQIYAAPMKIETGVSTSKKQMVWMLQELGYQKVTTVPNQPLQTGQYVSDKENQLRVYTRDFPYWNSPITSRLLTVEFGSVGESEYIKGVSQASYLEPLRIGTMSPGTKENRQLMSLADAPPYLERALLVAEDEKFYQHHGISPKGIAAAVWSKISTGHFQRGGSTLTQQLIKNLYLTNRRTFERKFKEIFMAILLDAKYDKKNILKAYFNEVYLGQNGSNAVHGFALGSYFYFGKPINELELHQVALLIAEVKGPTYYNPRKHPERAKNRRDWIIGRLQEKGDITQAQADEAVAQPLGVTEQMKFGGNRFPAFIDLVRREFNDTFLNELGTVEGLHIVSTLNPLLQLTLEEKIKEQAQTYPNFELAGVVGDVQSGAIRAMVGGKNPQFEGFNRALDAKRPMGSLVKPFVNLQAMMAPETYNVLTPLHDTLQETYLKTLKKWRPENYDHQAHGEAPDHVVPLQDALMHSYNVATVDLGMRLGVKNIAKLINRLGYDGEIKPYPSMLLGTLEMSPREVLALYQALASGREQNNFVISATYNTDKSHSFYQPEKPGDRFINENTQYLMKYLTQRVLTEGTGRRSLKYINGGVAGKTGTTGGGRDLWFAGWDKQHVAVVWSGKDDNTPTHKTSSLVVPLWAKFMRDKGVVPFEPTIPENIEWVWMNASGTGLSDPMCYGAVRIPLIKSTKKYYPIECGTLESFEAQQEALTAPEPEELF